MQCKTLLKCKISYHFDQGIVLPLRANSKSEVKINITNELRDLENPQWHWKINFQNVHHLITTGRQHRPDRAVAAEPLVGAKKFLPGPISKLPKTPRVKVFLPK